jgi:hypothetical protein
MGLIIYSLTPSEVFIHKFTSSLAISPVPFAVTKYKQPNTHFFWMFSSFAHINLLSRCDRGDKYNGPSVRMEGEKRQRSSAFVGDFFAASSSSFSSVYSLINNALCYLKKSEESPSPPTRANGNTLATAL